MVNFLQGSSTVSTQLPILPIVKEQARLLFDVWFIDLEKSALLSSNMMA
jgi:hypothetical protein